MRLQYKGHQITVADLAAKLKNGKLNDNPSLLTILKKRAAYQQYLLNCKKREMGKEKEEKKFGEVNYPEVHFPKFME